MTLSGEIAAILDSSFVKTIIAFLAVMATASPVLRFFHDRAEQKLREREVRALERLAGAFYRRRTRRARLPMARTKHIPR